MIFFDKKGYKIFTGTLSPKNFIANNCKSKNHEKLIIPEYDNPSIDKSDRKNTAYFSFARRFREVQPITCNHPKKLTSTLQSRITSIPPPISRISYKTITTNTDKSLSPMSEKSRQQVKKCGVFYEQMQPLFPLIINDTGMF